MSDCQEAIYSEEYEDYIIEYAGREEGIETLYKTDCYQLLGSGFGVVYQKSSQVEEKQRNMLLMLPRCFGLLTSGETLEEAGIAKVRRQPRLELFGQGVLFGIVDTGAGVRKSIFVGISLHYRKFA
jgi:hypothetical protein